MMSREDLWTLQSGTKMLARRMTSWEGRSVFLLENVRDFNLIVIIITLFNLTFFFFTKFVPHKYHMLAVMYYAVTITNVLQTSMQFSFNLYCA